ncbi:MAG TPA: hypothetical protein PK349_03015 [Candidatus Hydrogenedentes bacterium]|nr:hypothetical protein [Candidatus Hydrogenedentota bacterium]
MQHPLRQPSSSFSGPAGPGHPQGRRREVAPILPLLENRGLLLGKKRILCYGCGDGVDVDWLLVRRYPVEGYDTHVPFGYATPPTGHYDLVLFNYVLGRISAPENRRRKFREAFGLVRPGGLFAVTSRSALRNAPSPDVIGVGRYFHDLLGNVSLTAEELLPTEDGQAVMALFFKGGLYAPRNPIHWIDQPDAMAALCRDLATRDRLGLDVETTLEEPRVLCTVQFADERANYVIDALAIRDLSPLRGILENPSVLKIIHNAEFERQMFAPLGMKIDPVFDTLVASRKKPRKTPISGGHRLDEVCERELGIFLDKGLQTSDWTVRPLSEEQLRYAAIDAEVMIPLHDVFCPPPPPETGMLFDA